MTTNNETTGLAAFGTSGDWTVEIDQSTTDPEHWHLQIESRQLLVGCRLSSADLPDRLRTFLSASSTDNRSEELELSADVLVLRDTEHDDRIFILVGGHEDAVVRAAVAGDDLKCFSEALAEACSELVGDRALL